MSRMTTTKTIPMASIPVKAGAREELAEGPRHQEVGVGEPDEDDQGHQCHDDAGLFRHPRAPRARDGAAPQDRHVVG